MQNYQHVWRNIVTLILSEMRKTLSSPACCLACACWTVTRSSYVTRQAEPLTYLQVRYRYAARHFTALLIFLKRSINRARMNNFELFSGMRLCVY